MPVTPPPSVAFVIPAYNAAHVIAEAIASARCQSVPAREIIVVDDGSRDNTAEIAEREGARVIRQPNGGPAAARNAGIRATSAEWIALLDADDVCFPHRLERQLPHLDDPTVAVVSSENFVPGMLPGAWPDPIDFEMLWRRNRIQTSTAVVRKAAWESIGGFDEARELIGVEDYNLWLRLAHAGWRFVYLPETLVEYRPSPGSLTGQTRPFADAELFNVRRMATQFGLSDSALRAREHEIYRRYGLELFHYRDWVSARAFLLEAAQRGPLGLRERLRLWATWLPAPKRKRS
jgi:glycosyltransferase involved in cell wall biosynthesis